MFLFMEYSSALILAGFLTAIDNAMCFNRSARFGPSFASIPRVIVKAGSEVFPFITTPTSYEHRIELKDYPNLAVLIPIAANSYNASADTIMYEYFKETQLKRLSKAEFGRDFAVIAPPGFRVMATIQTMHLFRNKFTCKDMQFLQFGESHDEVERTCGSVDIDDHEAQPSTLIGPRSYRSKGEKLSLSFRFADSVGYRNWYTRLDPAWDTEFKLSVAFTAFQDKLFSNTDDVPKELSSELENASQSLYSCSSANNDKEEGTLIHANLFCDGVMNCGSSEEIGNDENPETCKTVKLLFSEKESQNGDSTNKPEVSTTSSSSATDDTRHFGFGLMDSSHYGHDKPLLFGTYQTSNYPTESNSNNNNNNVDDDSDHSSLSPPTTILVIVFVVIIVMLAGTILRFCCTKCVGMHPQVPTLSSEIHDLNIGVTILGENGLPIVSHQCSRVNAATDLPPSYEELFPSWKLSISEYSEGGNVNPSFESDSICLPARGSDGTNITVGKISSTSNV